MSKKMSHRDRRSDKARDLFARHEAPVDRDDTVLAYEARTSPRKSRERLDEDDQGYRRGWN